MKQGFCIRWVGMLLLGMILLVTLAACTDGIVAPPVYTPSPEYPPASPVQPPPTPFPVPAPWNDIQYADRLVRQYGWSSTHVVRWLDGYVDVYDRTGYPRLQEVLDTWNAVIGGPTVFRLSLNPASPVQVMYDSSLGIYGACGQAELWLTYGGYTISQAIVTVNPFEMLCPLQATFLHEFGHVIGFGGHTFDGKVMDVNNTGNTTISETVRIMVRRLYELPVGMAWFRNVSSSRDWPVTGWTVYRSF